MELNRYDRQERIENWDQKRLTDAVVHITGSNNLAQATVATLVGLGIGTIRLYDNRIFNGDRGYLMFNAKRGQHAVYALADIAKAINPSIKIDGINWTFEEESWTPVLGKPDVIVECENDSWIEELIFKYGQKHNVPVINGSSMRWKGELADLLPGNRIPKNYLSPDYYSQENGNATSLVIAGLIAEEVRKLVMPLNKEDVLVDFEVHYNILSNNRFEDKEDVQPYDFEKNHTVYVIGAGSLGNVVVPALAREGIKRMVIIDNDTIEDVNLNRQLYFWDAVGQKKATTLAEKIKRLYPKTEIIAYDDLFMPDFVERTGAPKPDLIMVCTDSWKSRQMCNDYALQNNVPLINGGSSYNGGSVATVIPGQTACLECLLDITKKAEEEQVEEGCVAAPQPSVINSNFIVGGLMFGEVGTVFSPIESVSGLLVYDANSKKRFYSAELKPDCQHMHR